MTKDRVQVKSHHQRLMKKHKSVHNYLDYYEVENLNKLEQLEELYITKKIQSITKMHYERETLINSQKKPSTAV